MANQDELLKQLQSQGIDDPFADHEILVKNEKGELVSLKDDSTVDQDNVSNISEAEVKKSLSEFLTSEKEEPEELPTTAASTPEPNQDFEQDQLKKQKKIQQPNIPTADSTDDKNVPNNNSVDDEIIQIVKESGVQLNNEQQSSRLVNIVKSRLKRVRNKAQFAELLTDALESGGVGLNQDQAKKIISVTENHMNMVEENHHQLLPKIDDRERQRKIHSVLQEPEPPKISFQKPRQEEKKISTEILKKEKPNFEPEKIKKPELQESPEIKMPQESQNLSKPVSKISPIRELQQPSTSVNEKKPMVAASSSDSGRPKIEDIRFRPKLTGPLEEIQSMTPDDFRKLSKNPKEAADKILDKIKLLEDEAFSKRIEGIQAWKRSNINQLYLQMLDECIEKHCPIEQINEEFKKQGKPYLTDEEIDAIIYINSKIRP